MIPSLDQTHGATTQASLTDLQRNVKEKLATTVIEVARDILLVIINSQSLSPEEFVEREVTPRQEAFSQLDERVSKFFSKVMIEINKTIDQMTGLPQSFKKLESHLQDAHIREKLVKGIAFPHVIQLAREFDNIDTSIVDDINQN